MPNLQHEQHWGAAEGRLVCGVDEVGRGPLAGPVMAAAALVPQEGLPDNLANRVRDSKKLSTAQRRALAPDLGRLCRHAVAEASVAEIDALNILQASLLAMKRAVEGLGVTPDHALVDGVHAPALPCPVTTLVGGDNLSLSIAVASILAKVARDAFMSDLALRYPGYGWERNAGYGTAEHLLALETLGLTPWHRRSYAPVARLCAPPKA